MSLVVVSLVAASVAATADPRQYSRMRCVVAAVLFASTSSQKCARRAGRWKVWVRRSQPGGAFCACESDIRTVTNTDAVVRAPGTKRS